MRFIDPALSDFRRQRDPARHVVVDHVGDHAHGRGYVPLLPDARRSPCGLQAMSKGPVYAQPAAVAESLMSVSHNHAAIISACLWLLRHFIVRRLCNFVSWFIGRALLLISRSPLAML